MVSLVNQGSLLNTQSGIEEPGEGAWVFNRMTREVVSVSRDLRRLVQTEGTEGAKALRQKSSESKTRVTGANEKKKS